MSRIVYILIASIAFMSCTAQKKAGKVYAYRQPVLQGASPTAIVDEKGKEVERPMRESANFYIYVESPSANVQVKEVWIKQKPYTVKVEKVSSTPIVLQPMVLSMPGDTLVKQTANKVLQITPMEQTATRTLSSSLQKKVSGNDLVVYCVINGRDQYYTSSIKNLRPVALQ